MSRSLSDPTGSFPAPYQKGNQPVEAVVERDQPWYELTDEEYQFYHRTMWNRAYLASGSANEADDIVNKVIDEVLRYKKPPSKAMIEPILHRLTTWRICDCLKSPRHTFLRMRCQSLTRRSRDGEAFEIDLKSDGYLGAEEEFFHWEKDEATAQYIAQAILRLNERQRACFVLRFMEKMKPEEIAQLLKIPAATVSTECCRARNNLRKWLHEWKQEQ